MSKPKNEVEETSLDERIIKSIAKPDGWRPYVQNGLTMVKIKNGSKDIAYPYFVDMVWDSNIRFKPHSSKTPYRALYIFRQPWITLGNPTDTATLSISYIAGIGRKRLSVFPISSVTFLE